MLEIILVKPIKRIVYINKEEALDVSAGGKSIRLDVYVDDEDGTVYDMEMQTTANSNIPKRLRYYQGMIDLNLIEKGKRKRCEFLGGVRSCARRTSGKNFCYE